MKRNGNLNADHGTAVLDIRRPSKGTTPVGAVPKGNSPPTLPGVIVGLLAGLDENGLPLVRILDKHADRLTTARTMCPIRLEDVGRRVVLSFENGDPQMPVILGLLQPVGATESPNSPVSVTLDGERLTLTAASEIVLRCGKSSITLTRAGKVLVRGEYVLSRSSGVSRIIGGSVQIN